jgi:hypothetical protein
VALEGTTQIETLVIGTATTALFVTITDTKWAAEKVANTVSVFAGGF